MKHAELAMNTLRACVFNDLSLVVVDSLSDIYRSCARPGLKGALGPPGTVGKAVAAWTAHVGR